MLIRRSAWAVTALVPVLILAGVLLDLAPVTPQAVEADEGEIAGVDWMTDLDAARKEAAKSGRPLLIVFR